MDGLLLGFDLCDDYSQISCFHPRELDAEPVYITNENQYLIPTVICKKKDNDDWCVGEEAYKATLLGEGILVDKLVRLAEKEGSETIEGIKYSAKNLLEEFLRKTLEIAQNKYQTIAIRSLVFCLQNLDVRIMDTITHCMDRLEIPRERVHIISRTESYIYYVLSQKRDIWNNMTAMFDLSDIGLHYYELKIHKGVRPQVVEVFHEKLEEGFNLEILDNSSGCKIADQILCACGERLMGKKIFSSVLLTGRGFHESGWAINFMKAAGNKRKLFLTPNVFAIGAAYKSYNYISESNIYPYIAICDGTLPVSVTLNILLNGKERQLVLASAGDNWYEARSTVELILDQVNVIDFYITPANSRLGNKVSIPLTGFPQRPNKTTKLEVLVAFTSEDVMTVRIKDKGFGELFPATDSIIREEIHIGTILR